MVSGSPRNREPRGASVGFNTPLMAASDVDHPSMKLRHSFLIENLSNWRASMSTGLIWFHFAVSVSFADENTRSQGTDVAWIGR